MNSKRFTYSLTEMMEFPSITSVLRDDVVIEEAEPEQGLTNVSVYLFEPENSFRQMCLKAARSWWFETIVIIIIIINSILLGIYDYENPGSHSIRNKIVTYSEPIFSILFLIECIIKIIAQGFVLDPGTYLRDGWNVFDFIVV